MGNKTGIEWTDSTWSPIRFRVKADAAEIARAKGYTSLVSIAEKMAGHVGQHCEHVSPGCEHCYAGSNNHRCLPRNGTGLPYDRRSRDLVEAFIDEKTLLAPLKWKEVWIPGGVPGGKEYSHRRPRRIFVENQSDLFGEWVTDEMLDRVFAIMALCPQHTFQVLTKRPERAPQYFLPKQFQQANGRNQMRLFHISTAIGALAKKDPRAQNMEPQAQVTIFEGGPLPNVWLGVSVENQAAASERIPLLLKTPAAVRFISAEPLLGPIDLRATEYLKAIAKPGWQGDKRYPFECIPDEHRTYFIDLLDWVIGGGESGPGARPMHPDWARSLRDQCTAAGVPFFFKQWGEWSEVDGGPPHRVFDVDKAHCPIDSKNCVISLDGHVPANEAEMHEDVKYRWMSRIGKKAAGGLLDDKQWHQFPEVTHAA